MNENIILFLVLFDYTKAFDTVKHKILLNKLLFIYLIYCYLLHRCQKDHLNGNISDPLNITKRVSQGSILGPLLFCMYINDLPDVLVDCNVHMYADDGQLYTSTRKENIDTRLHLINRGLDRIDNWASANELCINRSKFKFIMLS